VSSAVHRSAIHWLVAHRLTDPAGQHQVDALIRAHEVACAAEEGDDPTCPPCQYQHRCLRAGGCPIRDRETSNA
jgi:hypothetical protein